MVNLGGRGGGGSKVDLVKGRLNPQLKFFQPKAKITILAETADKCDIFISV